MCLPSVQIRPPMTGETQAKATMHIGPSEIEHIIKFEQNLMNGQVAVKNGSFWKYETTLRMMTILFYLRLRTTYPTATFNLNPHSP